MDFHLGILGLKSTQNRRQPRRSDTIITANIEDAGQDTLDGRPQVGGLLLSPAIGLRPDALLIAHEQREADFLLQRTDHAGHPRLRIAQFLASRCQTAILNRQEQSLAFHTIHILIHPFRHDIHAKSPFVSLSYYTV